MVLYSNTIYPAFHFVANVKLEVSLFEGGVCEVVVWYKTKDPWGDLDKGSIGFQPLNFTLEK